MCPYDHADTSTHIDQIPNYPPAKTWDTNFQCDPHNTDAQSMGNVGVTYWRNPQSLGHGVNITVPKGTGGNPGSCTISFTCTQPRGYSNKDACLLYYAPIAISPGDTNDIRLSFQLNLGVQKDLCYINGAVGQGAQQCYDLVNNNYDYNDTGLNCIVIYNYSQQCDVRLIDFQVVRTYTMQRLADNPCSEVPQTPATGTLDQYRIDYPCNINQCGGRSYTFHFDGYHEGEYLASGNYFEWSFNWAKDWTTPLGDDHNYIAKEICMFNFNQIKATNGSTDVHLRAYLNGVSVGDYYISKQYNNCSFPSIDLADFDAYNDTGSNTVRLTNLGDRQIQMCDGAGINIYRIYRTECISMHLISPTAGMGGSIVATPQNIYRQYIPVASGDNQQFQITANSNYLISDVVINSSQHLGAQSSPYTYTFNNVTGDGSISAEFAANQPTHNLTINAFLDPISDYVNVGVSVNGQYVGTTPVTVSVPEGTSTVYVDFNYGYWCFILFNNSYAMGDPIPVYSDVTLTARYA